MHRELEKYQARPPVPALCDVVLPGGSRESGEWERRVFAGECERECVHVDVLEVREGLRFLGDGEVRAEEAVESRVHRAGSALLGGSCLFLRVFGIGQCLALWTNDSASVEFFI